jgi:tryptophan synthase beta chain
LQVKRKEERRPVPEVAHAIKAAINLALEAREAGERRVILFDLCGHGHFDLAAYEQYLAGELVDLEHSEEEIERAVASIPD